MHFYIGVDIGGTKCAVVRGDETGRIWDKIRFPTADPASTIDRLLDAAAHLTETGQNHAQPPEAVGISCGNPMDARRGLIQEPPNLPGWVDVPITSLMSRRTGLPAFLCNDANACALAEWRHGAGQGTRNMIFLTFGTGMGAGLILDGRLYEGTTGASGEIGHVRLDPDGPVGYRKAGSVEGFCSGGGIAKSARKAAEQAIRNGHPPAFCPDLSSLDRVTARSLAQAATADPPDPLAVRLFHECGRQLGRTLAILVDLFNPERIVIGSIYARSHRLLESAMREALEAEALGDSLAVCDIVPAALTESVGDIAALTVAAEGLLRRESASGTHGTDRT